MCSETSGSEFFDSEGSSPESSGSNGFGCESSGSERFESERSDSENCGSPDSDSVTAEGFSAELEPTGFSSTEPRELTPAPAATFASASPADPTTAAPVAFASASSGAVPPVTFDPAAPDAFASLIAFATAPPVDEADRELAATAFESLSVASGVVVVLEADGETGAR